MRINRLKRIGRNLSFYVNNFGLRKPYKILIDGTFCFAALKDQLNIEDQLRKYLGNEIKLVTTQCVVLETEKLGHSVYGAMVIVKKFPVHKCGHNDKPVTGSMCLKSMISSNNTKHYIVATQDRNLQDELRAIPGVPLLYFYNKGPTLEAPSLTSQNAAKASRSNVGITKFEEEMLSKLKKTELGIDDSQNQAAKKKKRKGGPNPLSCKKKLKIKTVSTAGQIVKTKKRRRKRIPGHVKEELLKSHSQSN